MTELRSPKYHFYTLSLSQHVRVPIKSQEERKYTSLWVGMECMYEKGKIAIGYLWRLPQKVYYTVHTDRWSTNYLDFLRKP